MISNIYVGKNGIGKSKKLEEIYNNKKDNSLLINYATKTQSPDDNIFNDKNEILNNLFNFIINLSTLTISKNINDFQDIVDFWKDEKEKSEYIKILHYKNNNSEKLTEIWKDIKTNNKIFNIQSKKDKIVDINCPIKWKNDDSVEIRYCSLQKDLKESFKDIKQQIGTGNSCFCQIYIIYKFLDLIPEDNIGKFNLIIDEPELFLHEDKIIEMGVILKKINEKINVVISTHSAILANNFFCVTSGSGSIAYYALSILIFLGMVV